MAPALRGGANGTIASKDASDFRTLLGGLSPDASCVMHTCTGGGGIRRTKCDRPVDFVAKRACTPALARKEERLIGFSQVAVDTIVTGSKKTAMASCNVY